MRAFVLLCIMNFIESSSLWPDIPFRQLQRAASQVRQQLLSSARHNTICRNMATAALLKIRSHFFAKDSKSVPPGAKSLVLSRDSSGELPESTTAFAASAAATTSSHNVLLDCEDEEEGGMGSSLESKPHRSRCASNDENARPEQRRRAATDTQMMRHIRQLDTICTIGTGTFGRVLLVTNRSGQQYFALKVLSIRYVVHKRQVDHIHSEKAILQLCKHPFIVNLKWSWHDTKCLYLLFEYVPGGELFSYLRAAGRFSPNTARFYAAQMTLALEFLHSNQIAYRDMKPENLLLDKQGHLKLIDFGFAKAIPNNRTYTLCGTAEYMAPEVIRQKGHGMAVDWWGLGILIFEMITGLPPFRGDNTMNTYEKIIEARYSFPKQLFGTRDNAIPKSIIKKLLVIDPIERLGGGKEGADGVKDHRWFKGIDWSALLNRKMQPPIVPKLYHDGDTGNFDQYKEFNFAEFPEAPEKELAVFKNF